MDQFEHKTLVTKPFDLEYSYYLSPGFHEKVKQNKDVPVLMFSHGYPDDAHMWAGAMPRFLKLPYPVILMELLGLGDSAKPLDASLYRYKQQADSYAQILDHEGATGQRIIPIGHDWGSAISQRFYLHHRDRCVGLVLFSLAYQIPSSEPFDLVEANKATAGRFNYPQWEYWNFFCAPDAPKLMDEDLTRMFEVNHGFYPSNVPGEEGRDIWMREMFCTIGAMREYVARQGKYKDYTVDLWPYAKDPAVKRHFMETMKKNSFAAPVNYYHSLKDNHNLADESKFTQKDKEINVPLLYIGQMGDWVCRTDLMKDAVDQGLIKAGLEEHAVKYAHWCLWGHADEVCQLVDEWVQRKFPVKA